MEPLIKLTISGLGKRDAKDIGGVRRVNVTLGPGVLRQVGPNGAGKSTLMPTVATITRPTVTTVLWNGEDIVTSPNNLRSVLGYLPQDFGIYPNQNAVEFLEYMAAVKGLSRQESSQRVSELIELVNLGFVRKRALGTYSGGMKQQIGIAQALLNDPAC
jgi:ABC-2 type transport system ATP-binding protein